MVVDVDALVVVAVEDMVLYAVNSMIKVVVHLSASVPTITDSKAKDTFQLPMVTDMDVATVATDMVTDRTVPTVDMPMEVAVEDTVAVVDVVLEDALVAVAVADVVVEAVKLNSLLKTPDMPTVPITLHAAVVPTLSPTGRMLPLTRALTLVILPMRRRWPSQNTTRRRCSMAREKMVMLDMDLTMDYGCDQGYEDYGDY